MGKKGYLALALTLSLSLALSACGQEQAAPDPSLAKLREEIAQAGALGAVAYLGPLEEDPPFPEEYPFLAEIGEAQTLRHGGTQLYCLVPGGDSHRLTVRGDGALLYEGDGQPILLVCNLSEVVPNTEVTFTGEDGREAAFSPALGLCDGTVAVPGDGSIYDFSLYQDAGSGAAQEEFLGTWTAGDTALVFSPGGTMEYRQGTAPLSGTFYVVDSNSQYPPGAVLFEMAPAGDTQAQPFWGIFTLEILGDTLTLTPVSGDTLEVLTFTREG